MGGLGGILGIPAHPQRQGEHPFLIQMDQRLEGVHIPVPGGGDQLLFPRLLVHLKSLLIPFVTRYTSSSVFICTICSL